MEFINFGSDIPRDPSAHREFSDAPPPPAPTLMSSSYIAKYLDVVMRRGQGTMTSDQFNTLLDEIVSLVKFTKDKDIFKEFYVAQLAKRLLLGRSASFEEELSMVKKLQSGMSCPLLSQSREREREGGGG